MRNLGEALERVTRVAGIRGAMLVAESDGLVVAEALAEGLDGAAVAALAASLTLRLRRTAMSAGLASAAGGATPGRARHRAQRAGRR